MQDTNKESDTNNDGSGGRRRRGIIRRTLSSIVSGSQNTEPAQSSQPSGQPEVQALEPATNQSESSGAERPRRGRPDGATGAPARRRLSGKTSGATDNAESPGRRSRSGRNRRPRGESQRNDVPEAAAPEVVVPETPAPEVVTRETVTPESAPQESQPRAEREPRRGRRRPSGRALGTESKPREQRSEREERRTNDTQVARDDSDSSGGRNRGGRGRRPSAASGRSSRSARSSGSSGNSNRESQAPAQAATPAAERAPLQNEGSALGSYDGAERGKFGDIDVSGPVAKALAEMGYETPSPIQLEAVPGCLEGRDLVGQAITGSGKTAAFSIPIVERVDPYSRDVQAIVLVPTRELAMQVAREVERIGKYRGISVCAVYGGQPINRQLAALNRGVNVVVGTPGRVMDHMGRGTLDLQNVRVAVLDEADEMLDIGFAEDMEFILRHTPRSRQTLLFSATVPGFVKRLIRRYQDDPMWIQLGSEIQTVDEVDQIYFEVAERDKQTALRLMLDEMGDGYRMLVFRRTQIGVDRLARSLKSGGFGAMGLHGGLSQGERNQAMGMFRDGELAILVSTNVAARGIDIPEITHVVNYDMPDNVEEYVHRIGRTARMGRQGYAVTFMAEWDYESWEKIRQHVGEEKLIQGKLPIYD